MNNFDAERATIRYKLLKLWPKDWPDAGQFDPYTLEGAFAVNNHITKLIWQNPGFALRSKLSYLTLCQTDHEPETWAAGYDTGIAYNPEWYEKAEINNWRYAARGETPAIAIARAAAKVADVLARFVEK